MTTIKAHVSELEARYKTAVDPVGKSHFHALWLLSSGNEVDEVAELVSRPAQSVLQPLLLLLPTGLLRL
jgi:hypothetical protein